MRMKRILMTTLILSLTVNCATTIQGRYQDVAISSDPSGATVRVSCDDAPSSPGVTPLVVRLKRGAAQCSVNLAKPGFQEQNFTFTRHRSATTWTNIGPGLLVGLITGIAAWSSSPLDSGSGPDNAAIAGTALGTGAGIYIDRKTGAYYRQLPGEVTVTLTPQQ